MQSCSKANSLYPPAALLWILPKAMDQAGGKKKGVAMPLIQVVVALIVVGVLLWLVNLIPMQGTIKSILNTVVVIFVIIWLLNVFGLMPYLSQVHVGNFRL